MYFIYFMYFLISQTCLAFRRAFIAFSLARAKGQTLSMQKTQPGLHPKSPNYRPMARKIHVKYSSLARLLMGL